MWNFTNDKPVYAQIIDEIMLRIASGVYKRGARIPSVRDLAEEARVNPNTMQRALSEIEREGYIISMRTSGKYVTTDQSLIDKLGKSRADEVIKNFVESLSKVGLTIDEAIEMLKEYKIAAEQKAIEEAEEQAKGLERTKNKIEAMLAAKAAAQKEAQQQSGSDDSTEEKTDADNADENE